MITKCKDCDKQTKVTLVGYGASYMAEINCPDCGVSYDTNLSEEEINGLKTQDYCGDCGQVEWLCICHPYCGDHLVPLGQCSCKP